MTVEKDRTPCKYCVQYKRLRKTISEVVPLIPDEMKPGFDEVVELVEDEIEGHFGAWGHKF